MISNGLTTALLLLLPMAVAHAADGKQIVVDFEDAVLLQASDKANRVEQWAKKGVIFGLAHEPRKSKTKGLLGFFPHLASGHKGIICAMAMEPIPVRATFPMPVSSVTLALWGSTGTPALLEAFDSDGKVVDRAKLESVPDRKAPGDPVPIFTMTVSAKRIAYIEFSGPREGEYLAADEVRFTPIENDDQHNAQHLPAKD
jgi:hypothetical protein